MSGTKTPSPYRRRRASLLRNFWIYRRLVLAAAILGMILWFVLTNNTAVTIYFPFGLGSLGSTTGMVILLSALFGSVATALVLTLIYALRRPGQGQGPAPGGKPEAPASLVEDLPPPDYAARTPEGFTPSNWS